MPREAWGAGAHGKPSLLHFSVHFIVMTDALSLCTRAGGDEVGDCWETVTGRDKGGRSGNRRGARGRVRRERVRRTRTGVANKVGRGVRVQGCRDAREEDRRTGTERAVAAMRLRGGDGPNEKAKQHSRRYPKKNRKKFTC